MQPVRARRQVALRGGEHPRVQAAAHLVGARAHPVRRQQRRRQQRIAQVNLAIFVDQQRADEERGVGGQGCDRARGRVQRREARGEAAVAAGEVLQIPAARREPAVVAEIGADALQQQCILGAAYSAQPAACLSGGAAGMGEEGRVELPEAEPLQILAQLRAARPTRWHDHERPLPVPQRGTLAVDAPGRLRKALRAGAREAVLAAAAGALPRQPALARQPCHRGAHQALGEAEGRGEADQAAQGDRTAARGDGVAEHRDEERAAAQRALRAKIAQQGPNGGG